MKNQDNYGTKILKKCIKDAKKMTTGDYNELLKSVSKEEHIKIHKDDSPKGKMIEDLISMIDGVYNIVEIWDTSESPYNTKWKKEWLEKARKYGAQPEW